MKKFSFAAGMLTMALIGSASIGALAATGQLTITVDPINIQVNGETFQPKDAQGNDVPVFAYKGTTYAPLRALAEAYGLEVGYDAAANMATVGAGSTDTPDTTASPADYSDWSAEDEAAYQEFKGMWTIEEAGHELARVAGGKDEMTAVYVAMYNGERSLEELESTIIDDDTYRSYYKRMCDESLTSDCTQVVILFGHSDGFSDSLGRAVLGAKDFYIVGWKN